MTILNSIEWNAIAASNILPLSVAQRGLWVGQKIGPSDATYNIAEYVEIHGAVDVDLFLEVLRQVAVEAETVRVQIIEDDMGQPHQVVQPTYQGSFPFFDVSEESDPRAAAEGWMKEELTRPVNIASDPLWACALFRAAPDRFYWYHRCHHIVLDGFAGGLLARRVAEIYSARVDGREPQACEFGSLASLIEREREYRASQRFAKDRAFWRERLAGLPDAASLARRRVAPAGGLRRSTTHLSAATTANLRKFGRMTGGSLPQTLIALIASYFHRVTGADDLVFGTPVTARIGAEMRKTPGMVANAVPIRLSMSSEMTLAQVVEQVAKAMRQALRHQQYRYEDLRRDLGLMAEGRQISLLGVNIEPFDYNLRFADCPATLHNLSNGLIEDLTVFVYDRCDDQGVRIDFDANPALYTESELAAHQRRLLRLVYSLMADPGQAIGRVDILDPDERRRVLVDWNETAQPVPELPIFALFETQASRNPQAPAVLAGDRSLTYAELNSLADAWAHALAGRGIGPGDLVALALPRNENMLVALLAALKTGAAYLPLDSEFPRERLLAMYEDARPAAVITTRELVERLPACDIPTLFLDQSDFDTNGAPVPSNSSDGDRLAHWDGEATAYVIFTSGSTGRPKGVAVPHRALTNFLFAMQAELRLAPTDRLLAVTTLAFDIAALEMFLPLLAGASVVIAPRETVRDPDALAALAKSSGATLMQATPSLWNALLTGHGETLRGLRPLVGGEALSGRLAQTMSALGGPVINLYGPTETTIWSTIMHLEEPGDLDAPPIGRPLWNTQVYVLDHALQPVPVGVAGDLYIGGRGVACGYLNRPDLTAERFIANPYDPSGGRFYRTGDQARWRADGVLEFLGRNDHQVKIRGFRIEIGEIEAVLTRRPGIREAVVTVHTTPTDDKRLVAYVVPTQGDLDVTAVRSGLKADLPEYMVPSSFIVLDALPLTPNGKTDRKALPAPVWQPTDDYTAPRTPMEEALKTIWSECLGIERIGVHDNFFSIGGDSLMAARMVARIRTVLAVDLPLDALFNATTIADLAARLERGDSRDPLAEIIPIRTRGEAPPLFCIHPVIGIGWGYAGLLRHLPSRVPVYGLQSSGLQDTAGLPGSIEEMADRYLARIRGIQPHGPYRLLGWSFGGLVAHAMAERLEAAGESVDFLSLLDTYPFHPDSGSVDGDEALLVKAGLAFLGYDTDSLAGAPMEVATLADFLCHEYDVFSMPLVREMGERGSQLIERVRDVTQHNLRLARRFTPVRVSANMLFFVATQSKTAAVSDILDQRAEAWQPHVGGRLETCDVPCHHQDMLQDPASLEIIGSAVAARLTTLERMSQCVPVPGAVTAQCR